MSGSKEGHKRYRTSKKLKELVGKNVFILYTNSRRDLVCMHSSHKEGCLQFRKKRDFKIEGFYIADKHIPTRAVEKFVENKDFLDFIVNVDYLKVYREVNA